MVRSSLLRNFQKNLPEDLISTNKKWAFLIRKGLLLQEIYFKGSEIVAKQNSKVVKSEESRGKSHQIIKVIIRKCVEIWNSYYLRPLWIPTEFQQNIKPWMKSAKIFVKSSWSVTKFNIYLWQKRYFSCFLAFISLKSVLSLANLKVMKSLENKKSR